MAAPTASGLVGVRSLDSLNSANSNLLVRQLDDLIEIMSYEDVPLLKYIGMDGDESTNFKREWMVDELSPESVDLISSWANNNTHIIGATNVADADMFPFQVGHVLKIENELCYVTSITEGTHRDVTVTRGAFGTTAVAHDGSTTAIPIIFVGISMNEGVDTPLANTMVPNFDYNFSQIFDTSFTVTRREENSDTYGNATDTNQILERKFKELAILLEQSVIYGQRADASGSLPRTMGGIQWFLTQTGGAAQLDMNSTALEEKDLLNTLEDLYYEVGPSNMSKTVLCGPRVKRKINEWYAPAVTQQRKESTGGVVITEIETDFGTIKTIMLNRMPKNELWLVNENFMKVHPYKGGKFAEYTDLAVNGPYKRHEIYGDYTLVVKNLRAMGRIYNIGLS